MSTAFVIAMLAIAISLAVIFVGVRSANAKKHTNRRADDAGTTAVGNEDCAPGDGGSCDGGGGD